MRTLAALATIALSMISMPATLVAQVGYTTGFENPPYNASPTGVSVTGQEGFTLPANSVAARIYTYSGNALGVPAYAAGDDQFFAGSTTGTDARADHPVTLPTGCRVFVQFDVYCSYTGTGMVQAGSTVGSFALRRDPENQLRGGLVAKWSGANPPTWNADIFVGPGNASVAQVPDPAFQGLAVNTWYRWGYTVDFATGEYVEVRITELSTSQTTVYKPTAGTMPVPLQTQLLQGGLQPVNTFRLHANDGDNLVAVDNLMLTYGATYESFGAGCGGATGALTLQPVADSFPRLNDTFRVEIGNLPSNFAIMATGLSNTTAQGSIPLPLDLTPFGFPGCTLLISPDSTETLIGTGNKATWSLTIPNSPSLLGTEFFNQGFSIDAISAQLSASNGGAGCIGY